MWIGLKNLATSEVFGVFWITGCLKKLPEVCTTSPHARTWKLIAAKKTVHILSFSMHAAPMLEGEVIDTQGIMRDWQSIPPDTPLEKLHKVVCTR